MNHTDPTLAAPGVSPDIPKVWTRHVEPEKPALLLPATIPVRAPVITTPAPHRVIRGFEFLRADNPFHASVKRRLIDAPRAVYILMGENDARLREGKHILECEAANEHGNVVCWFSTIIYHNQTRPYLCTRHEAQRYMIEGRKPTA